MAATGGDTLTGRRMHAGSRNRSRRDRNERSLEGFPATELP